MASREKGLLPFLKDLMRRRKILPNQLAAELGISHATVSRWLNGKDIPNPRSCVKLAKYSGISIEKMLAIVNYLPMTNDSPVAEWPEFREYAQAKYSNELDDDIITIIEDLIERRRAKNYKKRHG